MSDPSLITAFSKPRTLDEQLASIHEAPLLSALARIKVIERNEDGYAAALVLLIFEDALTREVRTNPQRRAVIQALKQAIKRAGPPVPGPVTVIPAAEFLAMVDSHIGEPAAATLADSAEVTTEAPRDAGWDSIRETAGQLKSVGRLWLRGQVRLGMQLAAKKRELGIKHGPTPKVSADSAKTLPWDKLVLQETGYSRRSCDEFIRLADATVAKLKKAKKLAIPAEVKKAALSIFKDTNALALTAEEWNLIDDVIGTLTTGETQASLMEEIGLVPKAPKMPKGGKQEEEEQEEEQTTGQMAFFFFEAFAAPLINARCNPDYRKLLLALPLVSDEANPLSLATLESEVRALLADIADAQQVTAKPTTGRLIEA